MTQKPISVSVMPLENRPETLMYLGRTADALGYSGYLLPETWSYDMFALLSALAVQTEHISLGPAVAGIWGRSAGQIAMAAATLQELSGGRALLGLGASTPQLTEGLHDVPFERPFSQIRQTLQQVRALLSGERIALHNTSARPLKLNLSQSQPVPIFLAAAAPKSIRLAGELADGWMPFLYPRSQLEIGAAQLAEGADASSEPDRVRGIYPALPTVVAPDEASARQGAAWFIAFYMTTMGPIYPRVLTRLGYGEQVAAVQAANRDRRPSVVPPEAEILLDELTIYGTPEQAREKLAGWYDAGADMPGLLLGPNLSSDQIDFTLKAFR
jgi:alkanesulfonate monooxygenase SsuD/methylene tetrahydromethanopterin reductase-like flavin-dependent oxidoreductase (luciferase family)